MTLRPELGAAVTRLTWRGRDILRPAPDGATHPLETGSFPLVPYANRIDRGAFVFHGRSVALPPTPGFEPHALHGVGWMQAWTVLQTGPASVDLGLAAYATADWPWAWTASCRLDLEADGLRVALSITNDDAESMPAGLGLHPYFAIEPGTVLSVATGQVWLNDDTEIPMRLAPASTVMDWADGATVSAAPFVDNAYAGWDGRALLRHARHDVTLTASANTGWMQVYAPGAGGFVCLEPVTHRPNAHNAPSGEDTGLAVLAPGQTLSMSMQITASERIPTPGEDR
ncbi:aldose 1-epimerase [Brevundimonas sp. Root1423]|uniref:aldose 1-epimerase n=1 Tax=Brevundimonas sp. Root1423 TaxID=1736462 RepID=UPI001F16FAED|nr:aldose 1-epimerase [Brevundimonas sp. Root1423]